jgi:D-proline reductase (dithiol) PrdB
MGRECHAPLFCGRLGGVKGHDHDDVTSELLAGRSPLPPADYIGETRALYDSLGFDSYRWAERPDPPPFAEIGKPLSECRITLIGSGGLYRKGQVAFHTKDDTSVRVIATDTPTSELRTAHFAYDQTDARADANCVYPLDRLRELAADGVIGGLTDEAYAFMGGIYSIRRMEAETAKWLVERCAAQEPDIVLLVPV